MGRYSGKTCRLSIMLSLTFSFFLVEIVFGYMTNSMALIADSFHMLSDVLALLIAFACMRISRKSVSSSKNTFGWVRAEVLGALVNAVFLMALCFSIFVEALKRIIEPEAIENPEKILIVGVLGLVINIVGIFMFHGHSSLHGHSHARPVPLDLPQEEDDDDEYQEGGGFGGGGDRDRSEEADRRNSRMISSLGPVISGAHNISVLLNEQDYGDAPEKNVGKKTKINNSSKTTGQFENDTTLVGNLSNGGHTAADKQLLNEKSGNATGKKVAVSDEQLNMHGVFLHILGDAFGSVIVVANALVCMYAGNEKLCKYLDPSLSLAIALIITMTTLPLLKESAMILLQTVPTHLNVQDMKAKLLKSIDGVLAIHEFHVWRLAGNKIIATAHIRCRNTEDYMQVAEKVKEFFHKEGIHSTTIQPEFLEELNVVRAMSAEECALECPTVKQCAPSTCCSGSKSTATLMTTLMAPASTDAPPKTSLTGATHSVAGNLFAQGDVSGRSAHGPDAPVDPSLHGPGAAGGDGPRPTARGSPLPSPTDRRARSADNLTNGVEDPSSPQFPTVIVVPDHTNYGPNAKISGERESREQNLIGCHSKGANMDSAQH